MTPFLDHQIGPARQAMWALSAAVGVLLLIACANVSGLMLTRVSLRNHDDAIRLAIGGSRAGDRAAVGRRDGVADARSAACSACSPAQGLIRAIVALAPEGIPRLDEVTIDVPVAIFSVSVMALATLLCGVAPIRHASVREPAGNAERRQPHRCRGPFVSDAFVVARAADRPGRGAARRRRPGGPQLPGPAGPRRRIRCARRCGA